MLGSVSSSSIYTLTLLALHQGHFTASTPLACYTASKQVKTPGDTFRCVPMGHTTDYLGKLI